MAVTWASAPRAGCRAGLAARLALVCAALAACGDAPDGAREPAASASASAQGAESVRAERERGELLSFACQACHTFGRGEPHSIGPNLFGMFGRRAGALGDFEYSDALVGSGIVWTPEQLDAWLAEPNDFVRGTTMTFAGFRSAADRRALIGYLREATTRADSD